MKIKILKDVRTANFGRLFVGQIVSIPDSEAKEFIRLGDAEELAPIKTSLLLKTKARAKRPRRKRAKK
jgi:hypothetical protein